MKTVSGNNLLFLSPLLIFPLFSFWLENSFSPASPPKIPYSEKPAGLNPCSIANTTFQSGEELTYKIYYNWNFVWVSAGEMTFRVIDEDDQFHYQVIGETYESYDWFFKVRDYYDTWVQKDNLLPIMSIRNILEGKYTLYDYAFFDQFRQTCYNERGRSKEKIKEQKTFKVDACMHDIVSILYYSRNIDFAQYKAGQTFPIKIFMDKEVWPLQVKYRGKEAGKSVKGKGKFNTMKFTPEVIAGEVFKEGTELNVWVTDDKNRLPLIIESPLSVGSAKAVLKSYKGLRHPVTAKVGQ